jgi:hypothetical protein
MALGRRRGWFLPLGIAALVAMGVHLASEVMVDAIFVALGALDRLVEIIVAGALGALEAIGFGEEGWSERQSYAFAILFDVDSREAWARYLGVAIEVLVDIFLLRAALGWSEPTPRVWLDYKTRAGFGGIIDLTREHISRLRRVAKDYFEDLTVEKVYVPIASVCAVIAGTVAIGEALDNFLFTKLSQLPEPIRPPEAVSFFVALAISGAMAWRLGWRMILHAFAWAEARNEKRLFADSSSQRRRLRGLVPALFIVPIMLAAVIAGTPIANLFGGG